MRKFIRQLLLGCGAYIGFFALICIMLSVLTLNEVPLWNYLRAFLMMTAMFGGLFGVILLMAAIMFGIVCLIHKVHPIDKIKQIDEEEKAKDLLEAKTIEWKREFRDLQEESWNNYVKEKMKELDNASPVGSNES